MSPSSSHGNLDRMLHLSAPQCLNSPLKNEGDDIYLTRLLQGTEMLCIKHPAQCLAQRALSKWQQSSAGTTCFPAAGLLLSCGLWVEGRIALRVPRGNGILALSIGILSCNTARPGASLHVRDHGYPHTTAYCCHSHPDLCKSCLA